MADLQSDTCQTQSVCHIVPLQTTKNPQHVKPLVLSVSDTKRLPHSIDVIPAFGISMLLVYPTVFTVPFQTLVTFKTVSVVDGSFLGFIPDLSHQHRFLQSFISLTSHKYKFNFSVPQPGYYDLFFHEFCIPQ